MPQRPLQFIRHFVTGFGAYWKKRSSTPRPRAGRLTLEALEERVTPTAGVQEQYMLDLINRFRENPTAELALILNANDPNVNNDLTFFNVDRSALAAQWATLTPAPPLAWNDILDSTALAHSQAMLAQQIQSHQVPGELDPFTRMSNAGYTNYSFLAENIFAYARSVFEAEAAFAIDWGINPPTGIQNPAGHRANLLDPDLREVGIGLVNAPSGSTMGPLLVTQDFGNRSTIGNPFLLGTVYDDINQDGFYEPGEGLSGVSLTISGPNGTFQATTTAAGGYQLQVPLGAYQITASGGGLAAPFTRTVVVGVDNVQVDLVPYDIAAPAFTAPGATTSSTTPALSWTATAGATQYDLWVNDLTTNQAQVVRQTALTTNTYTPATPLHAGSYQAWIRVTTPVGTSPWSAAYSFAILPPAPPGFTSSIGTTTNLTPAISWSLSNDAATYDLWVNNVTTGQSQIIRQQNLTTTSLTPGTGLPLGSYQAWVRAYNNAGDTAGWSPVLTFTLVPPAAPTVNGPAAVVTSTMPTFAWTVSNGATQYDLWADDVTTGQSQVVRRTVATTTYTPASPLPRGQYNVWVRAGNSAGTFGAWSFRYTFLIDTTAPAIPALNGPAGPTANLTPTITWSPTGADHYDLWVNSLTTGQDQVIRQRTLSANSFTPTTPLAVGSYVTWVQAFDATNQTRGWSPSFQFTITAPSAPGQLAPVGATANTAPTLTWSTVVGAATYDLWVDDVTTHQNQFIRQTSLGTNLFTPPTALTRGQSYRFWVRAVNAMGNASAWSSEDDFTIM